MTTHPIDTWHRLVRSQDSGGLDDLLAEGAVFVSPIVHAPQRGIQWNAEGRIVEFKVMVRPLKAINLIHERMAAILAAGQRAK